MSLDLVPNAGPARMAGAVCTTVAKGRQLDFTPSANLPFASAIRLEVRTGPKGPKGRPLNPCAPPSVSLSSLFFLLCCVPSVAMARNYSLWLRDLTRTKESPRNVAALYAS